MLESDLLEPEPIDALPDPPIDPEEARMIAWDELLRPPLARVTKASHVVPSARGRMRARHATAGLVHGVPAPLRNVRCMWLEEGDEGRRCSRPAAWTSGTSLRAPRFYCEMHGRMILERSLRRPPRGALTLRGRADRSCG